MDNKYEKVNKYTFFHRLFFEAIISRKNYSTLYKSEEELVNSTLTKLMLKIIYTNMNIFYPFGSQINLVIKIIEAYVHIHIYRVS